MLELLRSIFVVLGVLLLGAAAAATVIDFDAYAHGQVIDLQFAGVTISADNTGGGPDIAVVFDSNLSGTRDPDLEAAMSGPGNFWSEGNLVGTNLGGLLIIQENSAGCSDGICNHPDDEGSRPAGSLIFDFALPVHTFGLDLIDIEAHGDEMGALVFEGSLGDATISFSDLVAASLVGNNSANRIDSLDILGLQIGDVTRIRVDLGGSGAIDNIDYTVIPEPSTAGLLALGLVALCARRRR